MYHSVEHVLDLKKKCYQTSKPLSRYHVSTDVFYDQIVCKLIWKVGNTARYFDLIRSGNEKVRHSKNSTAPGLSVTICRYSQNTELRNSLELFRRQIANYFFVNRMTHYRRLTVTRFHDDTRLSFIDCTMKKEMVLTKRKVRRL